VEHINRKFWDTLEITLKKSIVADVDAVKTLRAEVPNLVNQ
jgi:hypothetical protein